MNFRTLRRGLGILWGLLLILAACSPGSSGDAAPNAPASQPAASDQQPPATELSSTAGQSIREWASEAEASSEYGSEDWSASQVTAAPNTPDCGDTGTAWASLNQDTREWINLYYPTPVYPTEINVIETYYPDQVAQVDLIDMQGQYVTVYTGQPQLIESACPYTLSIPVQRQDILVQGVRVIVDQTVVRNWNEIDAVELVGAPGEGKAVRPSTP